MPLETWLQDQVVAPARALIDDTPIGGEVADLDRLPGLDGLGFGVEGTFQGLVRFEYAGWPPESTTDGLVADLCVRTGPTILDFVGMCTIDFGFDRFPLRAEIELTDDLANLKRFAAYIGNVDPETGAPPRLRASMILAERDEDGRNPVPRIVVKRRLVPIEWTLAFSIDASGITQGD